MLDNYFSQVFDDTVGIGDPMGIGGDPNSFAAVWTNPGVIEVFLPAGKTAGALTADEVNPLVTDAGVFAGQLLALRLNREFSCAGIFTDVGLAALVWCYGTFVIPDSCDASANDAFEGMTVDRFLALADSAVGGGPASEAVLTDYGVTFAEISQTAGNLNLAFHNCSPPATGQITERPVTGEELSTIEETSELTLVPKKFAVQQTYPNPFNPSATIVYALPTEGRVIIEIYDIIGRKVKLRTAFFLNALSSFMVL